jgi:hypothetical protein
MKRIVLVLLTVAAVAVRAQESEAWRARPIAEWSEDDAKQVLTQSPWVKTFTARYQARGVGWGRSRNGPRRYFRDPGDRPA